MIKQNKKRSFDDSFQKQKQLLLTFTDFELSGQNIENMKLRQCFSILGERGWPLAPPPSYRPVSQLTMFLLWTKHVSVCSVQFYTESYLHWTVRKMLAVCGAPTPLSAVQVYAPASPCWVFVKLTHDPPVHSAPYIFRSEPCNSVQVGGYLFEHCRLNYWSHLNYCLFELLTWCHILQFKLTQYLFL